MFRQLWPRLVPTRRRVVVYLAVILGILVVRLVLDVWAWSRLQAVSARLAPVYGGLDVASLSPPAVAPGENRARIASAAAALTTYRNDGRRREELTHALSGALKADPLKRQSILRRAAAENRLALEVLDEVGSRPKVNWEISYDDGPRMRLPSLPELRDLSSINAAGGLTALADGNADEAARRAGLGMTLAGTLGQEPNLLIQLIHIAVAGVQARLVRDVLTEGEPSAAALASLAASLEHERAHDPAVIGLIGEMKYINSRLGEMERGGRVTESGGERSGFWARGLLWFLRPAVRVGRARMLDDLDRMIRYARVQPFEREARGVRLPFDEPQPWWWRKISPMMLVGLGRAVRLGDEHRAILTLASTAVALRQCRVGRGRYPEHLDELNPIYLPDVPFDPFTGREPEYTRSGPGFTLRVAAPAGTQESTRRLLEWTVPR